MTRITQWSTMTREERQERLGGPAFNGERNDNAYDRYLVSRMGQGLPLSLSEKRRVRNYLKQNRGVAPCN